MNKKYYADIDLYFEEMKYGITVETGSKKQELVDMVKDFAKNKRLTCNTKTKKFFNADGKEVGSYEIGSRIF